jgi:hypothetical protein
MCVTTRESLMEETYLLVKDLPNGNRLLIYQNEAETQEKNAMILPIDALEIAESNLTQYASGYLTDIYIKLDEAGKIQKDFYSRGEDTVIRFKCGSYDIHIINRLNEESFAEINAFGVGMTRALYDWYRESYEDWSFVVCVFDSDKSIAAKHPIGIEYKPRNKEWLHFPLVDSHTGDVPTRDKIRPHQICLAEDNAKNGLYIKSLDANIGCLDFPHKNIRIENEDMFIRKGTQDIGDLTGNYWAGNMKFCLPNE